MRLERWRAPAGDRIPDHPRFPVLVYRSVEAVTDAAGARARIAALPPPPDDPVGGEGVASWS
jgi:uncharacterized protein YjlB